MSLKTDIDRLIALRDRLNRRISEVRDAAGGRTTGDVIEAADMWGDVKDVVQDLIFLDEAIEDAKKTIAEGKVPDHVLETLKERLPRNIENADRKLKRALRLEKKGIELLSKPIKKDQPEQKKEPEKKPAPKPQPKPAPKPTPKPEPSVKPTPATTASEPEEYVKKLNAIKENAERSIVAKLPAIEQQALDILRDFIDENLDTKDGNFVVNDRAVKAINMFSDVYLKAVAELSDYKGSVGKYLKNFKDLGTLMNEFQKSNGVDVKQAKIGAAQELVTNEILNRYSENGLNPNFVQPLRELLFNNISGGLNKTEAMAQLKDYIESGKDSTGKLGKYLEQTAQQGVDSYEGAVNTRIMQTFKINTYVMSGSLIATSSPQCRYCIEKLGGIIDRKDWPKIKAIAEDNGLIEGTTFDNLPINKNHWGCRHSFTPLTLTDKQRKKLLANPVNN